MFGVCDRKVREKLLGEADLNLDKAVKICHPRAVVRQHAETVDVADKGLAQQPAQMHGEVDAISFKGKWRGKDRDRDTRRKEGTERSSDKEFRDKEFTCKRCGGQHKARQCPAFGKNLLQVSWTKSLC